MEMLKNYFYIKNGNILPVMKSSPSPFPGTRVAVVNFFISENSIHSEILDLIH